MRQTEAGLEVKLAGEGWLDRDFVLTVRGGAGGSHAVCVPDGEGWMALASFCPRIPPAAMSAIALKILVDCSGSMEGMSMREVKKGLKEVVRLLGEGDRVSYSRFGTRVAHLFDKPKPCGRQVLEQVEQAIADTRADMGGTELEQALASTFALKDRKRAPAEERVLLLTDGDIWEVEKTVATAREAGQRVFVIGVGAAPAHSLLEDLAEQTGGACAFVTPDEEMAEAVVRMFQRMRNGVAEDIRLVWPQKPAWSSPAPTSIYDGETVHGAAFFKEKPAAGPMLEWRPEGHAREHLDIETVEMDDNRDLARLGGMWRFKTAKSRAAKRRLALRYELVSELTSLVLVARREDGEKLHGLPFVQQVPQMAAYGHGCFPGGECLMSVCDGALPPSAAGAALGGIEDGWEEMGDMGSPVAAALCQLQPAAVRSFFAKVKKLWRAQDHWHLGSVGEFVAIVKKTASLAPLAAVLENLAQCAGTGENEVWAAFLLWLLARGRKPLGRHEEWLLTSCLDEWQRAHPGDEEDEDALNAEWQRAQLEAWFEEMRLFGRG